MKHISPHALADMLAAAVALALVDPAMPIGKTRNPDPRPFAKREDGRARRELRRQVRAAKSSWLNS